MSNKVTKVQLRPYQIDVINQINERFKTESEIVVAACPSSGKTTLTLEFIKQTPGKFLILTHGQDVIRQMWAEEIYKQLDAEYRARIIYNLPQSLSRKEIPLVDYVVVDEAHQFTFAEMVQKILRANKTAKKIYLTGTPSKFNKHGYKPIVVSALDLIEQGYISDLYVGLFSTTAHLSDLRNSEGDLTKAGQSKLTRTVNADLDTLMDSLVKRLKATVTKDSPTLTRLTSKAPSLGRLGQTMIACASTAQAEKVLKYFERKKIKAVRSDSKNDPGSENILKFQLDPSIKVLVVVDRGVLGFNMPQLENVVDMTGSTNIDRIYQLYARVMRKSDSVPKKYFFKLAPVEEMQVIKFYMQASLCLMHASFISRYNGKNLDEMEIPVKVSSAPKREKSAKMKSEVTTSKKLKEITFDEFFVEQVEATKVLRDVYNKIDEPLNEYAMVKIGEIRKELFGHRVHEFWTYKTCAEEARRFTNRKAWQIGSYNSYQAAQRNGWLDSCCSHMRNLLRTWSADECLAEALRYERRMDFKNQSSKAYAAARRLGILEKICKHMVVLQGKWTLETCAADAKKYNTKKEWQRTSGGAYSKARLNNWLEECCAHMETKWKRKWNLDSLKADALKYKSRTEWQRMSSGAYDSAHKKGWLDECCAHMKSTKLKSEPSK